ncbi:F-box/WD repeat-containing protein [Endozoicomonas sp. YOMI1]|uniref:F-box/WD repeat-containing protein n=1 Tax=Endozoicomonas sp. YOMI1 TaxID=2828739 RepID=UPI002147D5CC|nr:hypothetical protein [Endozoicomonas sp. YOMI1]
MYPIVKYPKTCDVHQDVQNPVEFPASGFGRFIGAMSGDSLANLLSYLSIQDLANLELVSRGVRTVLHDKCGMSVSQLHKYYQYFLSLPKAEQHFYQAMATGNPQLLHHLRTVPAIFSPCYPVQCRPEALCAYYNQHFCQQMINAPSLSLSAAGCMEFLPIVSTFFLNANHNCLINGDSRARAMHIWAPDNSGSWHRELSTDYITGINMHNQHGGNILFLPSEQLSGEPPAVDAGGNAHEHLLSVVRRSDSGIWSEAQQMTVADIYPHLAHRCINEMILSDDGKSLVCIDHESGGAILCCETDGNWRHNNDLSWGDNHEICFSPDSQYIALFDGAEVSFITRDADGLWSCCSKIVFGLSSDVAVARQAASDDDRLFDNMEFDMAFSPDSRHFAAWSDDVGIYDESIPGAETEFYVKVAGLDQNRQWSHRLTITKKHSDPRHCFLLSVAFSPDGKLLVVATITGFDIWSLDDDNSWSPVMQDRAYIERAGQILRKLPDIQFSMNSRLLYFMMAASSLNVDDNELRASIWQRRDSGQWECARILSSSSLLKVSPRGSALVCGGESDCTDIYRCTHSGQWLWQHIKLSIQEACFNRQGCLIAARVNDGSLLLLGLSSDGTWQEKNRWRPEGQIRDFEFSPCSRSLQTRVYRNGKEVLTFWQIKPDLPLPLLEG